MRGRVPWGLVAVLFVVVPLVEIYLVIQAGQAIGIGWTILILVADSVLGAVLLKREGLAAWRSLTEALASYRVPARELADGALVLVGGTLIRSCHFGLQHWNPMRWAGVPARTRGGCYCASRLPVRMRIRIVVSGADSRQQGEETRCGARDCGCWLR